MRTEAIPPIFIPAMLTAWDELVKMTNHNYFGIAPQSPEGRSKASANHILTPLCIIHKPYYKLSHPRRPLHISQPKWNMYFINMLLLRSWSWQSCPVPPPGSYWFHTLCVPHIFNSLLQKHSWNLAIMSTLHPLQQSRAEKGHQDSQRWEAALLPLCFSTQGDFAWSASQLSISGLLGHRVGRSPECRVHSSEVPAGGEEIKKIIWWSPRATASCN